MRILRYAAFVLLLQAPPALAADLQVVCPPLVRDALADLADAYTQATGIKVVLRSDTMGKIVDDIRTRPADVIVLPSALMESLEGEGGVLAGTRISLARVEIGLAVRATAPRPDISTVAKLRAALLGARAVVFTKPGPPRNSMEAGIIDGLLKRDTFAGVHAAPSPTLSGVVALSQGDGDMALQVIPEILAHKDLAVVGPLPAELNAHIDVMAAASARTGDGVRARAFIGYITGPEAAAVWKSRGIDRH